MDLKQIKKEISFQAVAKFYNIDINKKNLWKKGDEERIKINNKNYNVIDYLLKVHKKTFKQITIDSIKIKQLQQTMQLQAIQERQRSEREKEREKSLQIINEAKKENMQVFLLNLGFELDKRKSSKNYAVVEYEKTGEKIIIYKKNNTYKYFNAQNDQDSGDIYNFFANRNVKDYEKIADFLADADRSIEVKSLSEAKYSYDIEKIVEEYKSIENARDYYYLTNIRKINKDIIQAYNIKTDSIGNVYMPLYLNQKIGNQEIKLTQVGYSVRYSYPTPDTPKELIKGRKGIGILHKKDADTLIISESYIDSLSYVELQNMNANTSIISTMGQTSDKEIEAIQTYLDKTNISKVVVLSDNDEAGKKLAKKITDELKKKNDIEVETFRPDTVKDFNELLKKEKEKIQKQQHHVRVRRRR